MLRSSRGFTLIEVIVALLIMSFLSLFTVQSIQQALKTKTKVQKDIDKSSTMRDALRIMERDINMAFNYRDIGIELYNETQDFRKKNAATPKPTPSGAPPPVAAAPPPPVDPEKYKHREPDKIKTQFIGDAKSMDFTSLSNVRMMEESKISQQAEIGYRLKPCRRRSTQEQSSNCLWRRVANYIYEDITKDGQETVLLENVTEFSLRYLGPGHDDEWVDNWKSNESGDDSTKNKFPYAVEITLEVKDPNPEAKDKKLRLTSVAAIRNPNNKEEKKPGDATTTDTTTSTPTPTGTTNK